MKLPKVIYAKMEKDGDIEYIVSGTTTKELAVLDEKVIVGIYRLEGSYEVRLGVIAQEITKEK